MSREEVSKDAVTGLVGILILAAIVWFCLALYTQSFRDYESVTVKSERAGLLMDPGADVKLHGVRVGQVGSVEADGDGATLVLEIDPDKLDKVPADATVSIVPPTVFGAKYVELKTDTAPGGPALQAGSTIGRARVTVEVNQTFDSARQALNRLEPVKLNAALSATAKMLDGRGKELGQLITATDRLTATLVDQVPAITASARGADQAARAYSPAIDDLIATLVNGGSVVENLNQQKGQLSTALTSISTFSQVFSAFLRTNETSLLGASAVLRPVTALLEKYAPEYNCVLKGVAYNDQLLSAIMGGPEFGGTHRNAHVTFMAQRGLPPYKYPQDLPKVAEASGPNCAGLPRVDGNPPYFNYDTGADAYPGDEDGFDIGDVPLGLILFGQQIPDPAGAK